jgi:hypothetical protein
MIQFFYFDGATPTKFGPRPFHSERQPSVLIICLQKSLKHHKSIQ